MKDPHDIILRPVLTEKGYDGIADKRYIFEVDIHANKSEIKKAVEACFKPVKVARVNTLRTLGKIQRQGRVRIVAGVISPDRLHGVHVHAPDDAVAVGGIDVIGVHGDGALDARAGILLARSDAAVVDHTGGDRQGDLRVGVLFLR